MEPQFVLVGEEKGEYLGFCCCGAKIDDYDIETGYCTHPMVWCNSCGGRYFLDCDDYDCVPEPCHEWQGEINLKDYPIVGSMVSNGKDVPLHKVPLCYIKRISGSNMDDFYCPRQLSHHEVLLLGNSGVFSRKEDLDETAISIMRKYGVMRVPQDEDEAEFFDLRNIPRTEDDDFRIPRENIMVDCNSFNAEEFDRPDFIDTSHAGITVACEIIHRGNPRVALYWGD